MQFSYRQASIALNSKLHDDTLHPAWVKIYHERCVQGHLEHQTGRLLEDRGNDGSISDWRSPGTLREQTTIRGEHGCQNQEVDSLHSGHGVQSPQTSEAPVQETAHTPKPNLNDSLAASQFAALEDIRTADGTEGPGACPQDHIAHPKAAPDVLHGGGRPSACAPKPMLANDMSRNNEILDPAPGLYRPLDSCTGREPGPELSFTPDLGIEHSGRWGDLTDWPFYMGHCEDIEELGIDFFAAP